MIFTFLRAGFARLRRNPDWRALLLLFTFSKLERLPLALLGGVWVTLKWAQAWLFSVAVVSQTCQKSRRFCQSFRGGGIGDHRAIIVMVNLSVTLRSYGCWLLMPYEPRR